jgi:hypothetical protein
MDALARELFGTQIGLLSLFTIVFLIVMGLYLWWMAARNMRDAG